MTREEKIAEALAAYRQVMRGAWCDFEEATKPAWEAYEVAVREAVDDPVDPTDPRD